MKQVTLHDFLTNEQIELAKSYWGKPAFGDNVLKYVIKPNMAAINKKLGQENDPRYLAYMVEYVFSMASK